MKKILCHVCCAVCCAYPAQKLYELGYEPIFYFYNPNIYPLSEYLRRLEELKNFCEKQNYVLIIEPDDKIVWDKAIKGLETEPERGERCKKCFELRLEKTVKKALSLGISEVTTTLTVSPHKKSHDIFAILQKMKEKYNINYSDLDFKKNNGFLMTTKIAEKENFYRQNYCGCEYSIKIK